MVERRRLLCRERAGLLYGGCHGENEVAVFAELCDVVDDVLAVYEAEGRPLPQPTSAKDISALITA